MSPVEIIKKINKNGSQRFENHISYEDGKKNSKNINLSNIQNKKI